MTDRELLEAAATAAGHKVAWEGGSATGWVAGGAWWNPLTDDGDALRLAVACRIGLEFARLLVIAGRTRLHEDMRDHGGSMGAATRRAIVRAAAAMVERGVSGAA